MASPEGTRGIIVKQETYEYLVAMRDDINRVLAEKCTGCRKATLDDVIQISLGVGNADPVDETGRAGLVRQCTLFILSRSLGLPYDPYGDSIIDWANRNKLRLLREQKAHMNWLG